MINFIQGRKVGAVMTGLVPNQWGQDLNPRGVLILYVPLCGLSLLLVLIFTLTVFFLL